jgi:soluble lytic murein transglycosylase-like protein
MTGVQKAILPGIFISCLMLLQLNSLVIPVRNVKAESNVASLPAASTGKGAASAIESCQFQQYYPVEVLPWCALVEEQAALHQIDPLLIAAVMLVESGGQPQVVSHSGAVGLMQVMPRDGVAASFMCLNGPCFATRPSTAELKDPAFNIAFGTRMLAGLILSNGNLREGLKAYGPADVGYWYADLVLATYTQLQEN